MRDPTRIDRILALLGKVWKKMPDIRLGQLISNFTRKNDPQTNPNRWQVWLNRIYYTEDDQWETILQHELQTGDIATEVQHINKQLDLVRHAVQTAYDRNAHDNSYRSALGWVLRIMQKNADGQIITDDDLE